MATVTNKEFRDILNRAFPFDPASNLGRGATGRYRANKRPYGDYLFAQDRPQFQFDKAEYEAGRLPHLDRQ
jgi:hypothetical protein